MQLVIIIIICCAQYSTNILWFVLGDDISTGDPDAILERFMSNVNRSRSVAVIRFYCFILVTCIYVKWCRSATLPPAVISCDAVSIFKSRLKTTHLFNTAYSWLCLFLPVPLKLPHYGTLQCIIIIINWKKPFYFLCVNLCLRLKLFLSCELKADKKADTALPRETPLQSYGTSLATVLPATRHKWMCPA